MSSPQRHTVDGREGLGLKRDDLWVIYVTDGEEVMLLMRFGLVIMIVIT
jgi:hypothetical protein